MFGTKGNGKYSDNNFQKVNTKFNSNNRSSTPSNNRVSAPPTSPTPLEPKPMGQFHVVSFTINTENLHFTNHRCEKGNYVTADYIVKPGNNEKAPATLPLGCIWHGDDGACYVTKCLFHANQFNLLGFYHEYLNYSL